MILDDIKTLIENNKLRNAIDLLKTVCTGPMQPLEERVILLSSRLNLYHTQLNDNIPTDENVNELKRAILAMGYEFNRSIEAEQGNENKLETILNSSLLIDNSFPFVNRSQFRANIDEVLSSERAQVLLVKGTRESGMSYLEKYLKHLNNELKMYNVIPCDIPLILDSPNMALGETLAKFISNALNMTFEFDDSENEQFKFTQFINNLKTKIRSEEKMPLFFMHDFHKLEDENTNLLDLIYTLIYSITNDFPKSLFIIAGLNYTSLRNWHSDLRFTTKIYQMETVTIEDVNKCLKCIFGEYQPKISEVLSQNISEQEYLDAMVEELTENDGSVNIKKIGEALREHLFTLKN